MDQDHCPDGRAKSRPGTGLSLALNSTIISPKFVGAYRIRPPHGFEPGLGSTVIERSRDAAHTPDGPRSLSRWSSGVETRHRIIVGITFNNNFTKRSEEH